MWGILAVLALLVGYGSIYAATVPLPNSSAMGPTMILDRNGALITTVFPGHRSPIPYGDLPWSLKDAIVATEDKTFWTNPGLNPTSIVRALLVDITHGRVVQGGSTITQQLAKTLFLTESRSIGRKFMELFLSLRLAGSFSKAQIMTLYFNNVYFGEGAYGIENAAETYFGIPAKNLSLAQSALLAGLVAAPSAYDPFNHPRAALARRRIVLTRMLELKYISRATFDRVVDSPLNLTSATFAEGVAPYFVDYVLADIRARDPALATQVMRGAYKIYTTLDLADQEAADQAVKDHLPPTALEPETALVALDPTTGGILAMVGGRNYAQAPYNRASDAFRQPGSAFKPILYSALLSTGQYTAASMMDDASITFPGAVAGKAYQPTNASGRYLGPMILRRALMVSDNVVAVKWLWILGTTPVIEMARALGITTPLTRNLTLALGSSPVTPLELASAYTAFPDGGVSHKAVAILQVVDPAGRVVFSDQPLSHPALSPQIAFIMTSLLQSVFSPQGTGAGLSDKLNFQVAGKTGTSNNNLDGWLVGYSSDLVAAVWVGYDNARPLSGEGSTTAGPIWSDFMALAENANPPPDFTQPSDIVAETVCTLDGFLDNGNCPTSEEYFISGTQPDQYSPIPYDWAQANTTWPNATQYYYSYHGPNPQDPKWDQMMGFAQPTTPGAAGQKAPASTSGH